MQLSNNGDLHAYLVSIAAKLRDAGADSLSETLLAASRTAWAMPVTEFLGESRIALKRVLAIDVGLLNQSERLDMLDIVQQIDGLFERR